MDQQNIKGPLEATVSQNSIELANATAVGEKQGTHGDELDMDRMGKLQVLQVRLGYSFISLVTYMTFSGNSSSCPSMGTL